MEQPHSKFHRVPYRVSFCLLCIGVMANQILGFLGGGKGVGNPSDRQAPNPVDFLKVLSTGTVDTILKL